MQILQQHKQPSFYIALWLFLISIFSCTTTPESVSLRELKDFDSLPHSVGDSLLFSDFYSTKPRVGKGLQLVRSELMDTTTLRNILDTTFNDSINFRAKLLLTEIYLNQIFDFDKGGKMLSELLGHSVESKQTSQLIFLCLSTYLLHQERHTESMAFAFLSNSIRPSKGVVTSFANSVVASNLLLKDAFENAIQMYEVAESKISDTCHKKRLENILINKSVALSNINQHQEAIQVAKKALLLNPHSSYIKNKLSQIYSYIDLDSSMYYLNDTNNMNNEVDLLENKLFKAQLYQPLLPNQSFAIYKSIFSNIDLTEQDFYTQLSILNGLIQTSEYTKESVSKNKLLNKVDSILNHQLSHLNLETHEHYLEFIREVIFNLVDLQATGTKKELQSIITELERHQKLSLVLFLQRFGTVQRFHSILTNCNIYINNIPKNVDSQYSNFALSLLPEIEIFENPKSQYKSITQQVGNTIQDENNTGKIYLFQVNNEIKTIYSYDTNFIYMTTSDRDSLNTKLGKLCNFFHHLGTHNRLSSTTAIILNIDSEHYFSLENDTLYNILKQYTTPIFTISASNLIDFNQNLHPNKVDIFAFTDINKLELDGEVSELPGSYREAQFIKNIFPASQIFASKQVKPVILSKSLKSSPIVHIAMHGSHDQFNKYLTGIKLKNQLNPYTLFPKHKNNLQLVSLLSCHANDGPIVSELGKISLVKMLTANPGRIVISSNSSNLKESESYKITESMYQQLNNTESLQALITNLVKSNDKIRVYL